MVLASWFWLGGLFGLREGFAAQLGLAAGAAGVEQAGGVGEFSLAVLCVALAQQNLAFRVVIIGIVGINFYGGIDCGQGLIEFLFPLIYPRQTKIRTR